MKLMLLVLVHITRCAQYSSTDAWSGEVLDLISVNFLSIVLCQLERHKMGIGIASTEPMHPLDSVVFVAGVSFPIAIKKGTKQQRLGAKQL